MSINLHVVAGSTRPGRVSRTLADWIAGRAAADGRFATTVVDLAEINLPFLDEPEHASTGRYRHAHTRNWSALVDSADAFVFVSPEYNRGIAAPLKNALDFLFREWAHKPVGFVSYGMMSGGLRAMEMTRQIVGNLRMVPTSSLVHVPRVPEHLDGDQFRPTEPMVSGAGALLDELAALAPALAPLRDPHRAAS